MKTLRYIAGTIALLGAWSASAQSNTTEAGPFDVAFEKRVLLTMRSWGAPGLVVTVVRNGQTLHSRGYGTRVQGEERPVDSRTRVHLASHSKAVTAIALAMLIEEGKLSWDDRVVKHIPEFVLPDSLVSTSITVRDLVLHRSGITTRVPGGFNNRSYGAAELLAALKTEAPAAGFRERQVYSNAGLALAGEIVARVSGLSWERFVRERMFVPLGMNESYTSNPDLFQRFGKPSADKNIFLRASKRDGAIVNMEWSGIGSAELYAAAGGIVTTATDLTKWMNCLLRDGAYEGGHLLSAKSLRELWSPAILLDSNLQNVVEAVTPLAAGGLGWMIIPYAGRRVVQAPGAFMGSVVALVPDEQLGVAVATNLQLAERMPYEGIYMLNAVVMTIIDLVLGLPERDWNTEFNRVVTDQSSRRKTVSK